MVSLPAGFFFFMWLDLGLMLEIGKSCLIQFFRTDWVPSFKMILSLAIALRYAACATRDAHLPDERLMLSNRFPSHFRISFSGRWRFLLRTPALRRRDHE